MFQYITTVHVKMKNKLHPRVGLTEESCLEKVKEGMENITGYEWELFEEGIGGEQQELVQIRSSALVSVPEERSVKEIHYGGREGE